MKLYRNTTKRIAKKKIGRRWAKFNFASQLKPGDLISTCKGYNEKILEITPCWTNYGLAKGEYICDFDIITESGSSCSLMHCCTTPTETLEEVIAYWKSFNTEEGRKWLEDMWEKGWKCWRRNLLDDLRDGKQVFDKDGQPLYEYAEDYEKKARFPDRWAKENANSNAEIQTS